MTNHDRRINTPLDLYDFLDQSMEDGDVEPGQGLDNTYEGEDEDPDE